MEVKKLINFSEVSLFLTGTKNTIRANRNNAKFSEPINELVEFLEGWVEKNSKSGEGKVTIKTQQ